MKNDDGDGYFFDFGGTIIKSEEKVHLFQHREILNRSNFILGHQRWATHGKTKEYIQPFQNKEFAIIHNGVLGEFAKGDKSDTFCFFQDFTKKFNNMESGNREKRIKRTIKSLLDDQWGTFSIAIFDKVTDNLYYFKNNSTTIHAVRNKAKNMLYLTTESENKDYLEVYYSDFEEYNVDAYKIYRIKVVNDKIVCNIIGEIKRGCSAEYSYYMGGGGYGGRYGSYYKNGKWNDGHNQYDDLKAEEIEEMEDWNASFNQGEKEEILKTKIKEWDKYPVHKVTLDDIKNFLGVDTLKDEEEACCDFCQEKTRNYSYGYDRYMCDKCLMDYQDYVEQALFQQELDKLKKENS